MLGGRQMCGFWQLVPKLHLPPFQFRQAVLSGGARWARDRA